MLCPNVNVNIFGCVLKSISIAWLLFFFLFFSNEVGAEAKNPGCTKDFWSAGANHLLDLIFFFTISVPFSSAEVELKKKIIASI